MGKCEGKCELDKKNRELQAKGTRIQEVEQVAKRMLVLAHRPMRRECFTLESGDALLEWPSKMSATEHKEFSMWLDLVQDKIRRHVNEIPDPAYQAAQKIADGQGSDTD